MIHNQIQTRRSSFVTFHGEKIENVLEGGLREFDARERSDFEPGQLAGKGPPDHGFELFLCQCSRIVRQDYKSMLVTSIVEIALLDDAEQSDAN